MTLEEKLNYCRDQIEHHGIYRCRPGERLPAKQAGQIYTWQFYLRRCMFDPKFVFTVAELLVQQLPSLDIQIGACEDAGVPLGLAISTLINQPMLSIKKSRKAYGLLNFTEGPITGLPIVLVDDLAGSQTTLINSVNILTAFNLPVAKTYMTLINKTMNTHNAYVKDLSLISLFSCEDFAMTWQDYVKKYNKEPEFGSYY